MRKTPDAAAEYTPFETVLSMQLGIAHASNIEGHDLEASQTHNLLSDIREIL